MKRFSFKIAISSLVLATSTFAYEGYIEDYERLIEGSHYFTPKEKEFAAQLLKGADRDDTILDAILDSELISDKQKEVAKEYFHKKKAPKKVHFKQEGFDEELKVTTPRMRFHGDLDLRIRNIDSARDVSNQFALDNADYDEGMHHLFKGNLRYHPEGRPDGDMYGNFHFDLQGRDGETEIINAHLYNRGNYMELGTFLSPNFSEFGLRNTEFSGINVHLEHQKWVLDWVRGNTAEDYVPVLDDLSLGGGVIRRYLSRDKRDWIGASYYDMRGNHFMGILGQSYMFNDHLRFYTEFMHRDGGAAGRNGSAREFELDYDHKKVLFLNEFQKISPRFASTLNPEYSNFSNTLNEMDNREHAFTYRFDPWVTSSVIYSNRKITPAGNPISVETSDSTWALMTHRPDRPKYMFVLKSIARADQTRTNVHEKQMIAMGRTTFKARDMVTSFDVRVTDFNDNLFNQRSFVLNTVSVEFSRPFLNKLWVKEKLTFLDQNFNNSLLDAESQLHHLQVEYRPNRLTTLKGSQRYRRVARKARPNKYKTIYSVEAHRKIDENLAYKLRMDSFNNNEFTKGYDANLISLGADLKF